MTPTQSTIFTILITLLLPYAQAAHLHKQPNPQPTPNYSHYTTPSTPQHTTPSIYSQQRPPHYNHQPAYARHNHTIQHPPSRIPYQQHHIPHSKTNINTPPQPYHQTPIHKTIPSKQHSAPIKAPPPRNTQLQHSKTISTVYSTIMDIIEQIYKKANEEIEKTNDIYDELQEDIIARIHTKDKNFDKTLDTVSKFIDRRISDQIKTQEKVARSILSIISTTIEKSLEADTLKVEHDLSIQDQVHLQHIKENLDKTKLEAQKQRILHPQQHKKKTSQHINPIQ